MLISGDRSAMRQTRYFGHAKVLDINKEEGLLLLQINCREGKTETWGRIAIPCTRQFTTGETVLAAGEDVHNLYVIGILDIKDGDRANPDRVAARNGAYAEVNETGDAETLQVRSGSGEMIFEYNPDSGKCRVNVHSGNLEFTTKNGDINFVSSGNIGFFCRQSIEMISMQGIRMAVAGALGKMASCLSLASGKMKISSPDIDINACKGTIDIEESKYSGKKFSCSFEKMKLVTGRLESTADNVVAKAGNVYRTVEGLTQLYAKQMRTLVGSTYHFKSKKAFLKTDEDFKIKGDKIHLG